MPEKGKCECASKENVQLWFEPRPSPLSASVAAVGQFVRMHWSLLAFNPPLRTAPQSRYPRFPDDTRWDKSVACNMRHGTTRTLLLAVVGSIAASARAGDGPGSLPARLAWQIALERVGFSPGVVDGSIGRKTELATREFQRVRGLSITGKLDAATAAALGVDTGGAVTNYTVQADDHTHIGPLPKNWLEKSRLSRLGYENLAALIAEKFHCSTGLLARLNPGRDLGRLQTGDSVIVPAVGESSTGVRGDQVEIDLSEKVVRVLDRERKLVGLFHCSIAKDRERLPSGETSVEVITENPTYTFDPKMWPEVKGVDRKLLIPPGPRNPVGRCWIGLSLPGYGIHGSPNPEMIGKTGSHGCFRLTNWDALRLGGMIRVGTRVRFLGHGSLTFADSVKSPRSLHSLSASDHSALRAVDGSPRGGRTQSGR
jgi:lipoprotein-anchoring transpeptidase ErfK/SrfK